MYNTSRSFSNQINEAYQTSRGYRVGFVATGRDSAIGEPSSSSPGHRPPTPDPRPPIPDPRVTGIVAARFRLPSKGLLFDLRAFTTGGRQLWTTQGNGDLDGLSYASDPVGANDRFYVLAYTNAHISTAYVVCLDARTGQLVFKTPVASGVDSFSSSLGNFFSAHGGLTVADGRVFASTDRGAFVALDALDGSMRWISACDRIFQRHTYGGMTDHTTRADVAAIVERSHSAPVVGKSAVYFLSKDHPGLFALDKEQGRRLFVELPRTVVEILGEVSPRITQPSLMIAASRDELFALHADTGLVAWEFSLTLSPRRPWRSGFMHGGRIYWPVEGQGGTDEILVLDASTGLPVKDVSPIRIDGLDSLGQISSIRQMPNGEPGNLAAFVSDGGVDRLIVLTTAQGTVPISESFFGNGDCPPRSGEPQGGTRGTVPFSILPEKGTVPLTANEGDRPLFHTAEKGDSPPVPPPLPPLDLLWRVRLSPEQSNDGDYVFRVLPCKAAGKDESRMLVAGGSLLQCFRFDATGERLWSIPTPPWPKAIALLDDGRLCLRWLYGVEIYEFATGRRLWGWSSGPSEGRDSVNFQLWGVCQANTCIAVWGRSSLAALSPDGSKVLWTHPVGFPNTHSFDAVRTQWGILLAARNDPDYGGMSILELLDEKTGKRIWKHDLPKNTLAWVEEAIAGSPPRVWTASLRNFSRLSMIECSATGVKEVWTRDVGPSLAIERVREQPDRMFLVRAKDVLTINRLTGKDLVPPIAYSPATGTFRPGPKVHVYFGGNTARRFVVGLDPSTGKELWRYEGGGGNPAASLPQHVLLPGSVTETGGGYYWAHVVRAYLGTLVSLDLATGQPIGLTVLPGRNLWDVDYGRGDRAIEQIGNFIVLRTEQGPVVLGPRWGSEGSGKRNQGSA